MPLSSTNMTLKDTNLKNEKLHNFKMFKNLKPQHTCETLIRLFAYDTICIMTKSLPLLARCIGKLSKLRSNTSTSVKKLSIIFD